MAWHRFHNTVPLLLLAALAAVSAPQLVSAQTSSASQSRTGQSAAGASAAPKAKPVDTRKARQEYQLGMIAERAGSWNEAFQHFSEAAQASPGDKSMRLQQDFARSALVSNLSSQAEKQIL